MHMNFTAFLNRISRLELVPIATFIGQWSLFSAMVGLLTGSASALFLHSLDWVTQTREANFWIVSLLPIGGLIVGLAYHYFGNQAVKGNNLLFEAYHDPTKVIPFRMAPLVLFGTLVTHLFGGSAGREGTAVQMGGAIADRCTNFFKLKSRDKKIMLTMGVSGGFASVFGTPLAGAVFALEVIVVGRIRYEALWPSLLTAIVANYTCTAWQVHHTKYLIDIVPSLSPENLAWTVAAGICFGLVARLFSVITHFWSRMFIHWIAYPPFRPLVGGIVLAAIIWFSSSTRYIGLGVSVIEETFVQQVNNFDFLLKALFTSFTLGAGFKGGEVTTLFYIGATLGNALSQWVMLPMALLAGMGFVAVFSGATNTPIACTMMGIELFGSSCGVYVAVACVVAYLLSGHSGIYDAQLIGTPKHHRPINKTGKNQTK